MDSARARSWEETPGRLDIRKQVKDHLMSLGRSHCQSSFEEARTTDTQAQDWSCSASVIRGGAWSCLSGQLPTPWVLVEAKTALVGEHHFPEGTCRDQSRFSEHGACKGRSMCPPSPRGCQRMVPNHAGEEVPVGPSRSAGRWACRGQLWCPVPVKGPSLGG